MRRRLLIATAAAVVGYGLGWADRAYGHTPVLLLCLIAGLFWLAGSVWTISRSVVPMARATAEAQRERDEIAARLAQLEDGGSYVARSVLNHPSVRSRVYPQQRQGR